MGKTLSEESIRSLAILAVRQPEEFVSESQDEIVTLQKKQDTLLSALQRIVKLTYDFDDSMDTEDLKDLLADINDKANAAIVTCGT